MDRTTIQHVRSHGAALDRSAFDIADRFLDAFFARCPHLRTPAGGKERFRGSPDRQRRAVAHQWAWFVRHLGELDNVTPELDALAAYLRARGVTEADFRLARASLIEALREVSGSTWTDRLQSDWTTAIDAGLTAMLPARPIAVPAPGAYSAAA